MAAATDPKKDKKKPKGKDKAKKKNKLTAKTADKHKLYEESVQAPEVDVKFFSRYFKRYTDRPLRVFREDFCGTFTLSTHFVQLHEENEAVCVDLDKPTLDWGREHNLASLGKSERGRVHIIQNDVNEVHEPQADLTCAMNFSYCIFKQRAELHNYIANAFKGLKEGGLFMMDIWGGAQTQVEQEEARDVGDFTYVWDQHSFDPLSYDSVCRIHFEFKDGTRMKNAFVYDWRLWTPPDLREAFAAAGFDDIHFLWEGSMKGSDEGNGIFRRKKVGDADDAWIAYIVGQRPEADSSES